MYSSAIVASGKLGAKFSCWKVVYELMWAAARVSSSSVLAGCSTEAEDESMTALGTESAG